MLLHENIREIRKRKALTQEGLAEVMGVSAASVSKWETGQATPELGVLCSLAEYFEVSVDALLGHVVMADRKEQMLTKLKALRESHQFDQAKELAESLLRGWPNDYAVVDEAATLYYCIFVYSAEKQAMETAISLVKRLFPLAEEGEKARLVLLTRLANQYELLQDWDMARKYYEEGNVSGVNDRPLAYMQARETPDLDAIARISRIFGTDLYNLAMDAMKLMELWQGQGEAEKAAAALKWAVQAMENCGPRLCKAYNPVMVVLYLNLAGIDEANAQAYVAKLTQLGKGEAASQPPEFLEIEDSGMIASQGLYDEEFISGLLSQLGQGSSGSQAE